MGLSWARLFMSEMEYVAGLDRQGCLSSRFLKGRSVRPYVIGRNQLCPYNGNGIDRLESDIE